MDRHLQHIPLDQVTYASTLLANTLMVIGNEVVKNASGRSLWAVPQIFPNTRNRCLGAIIMEHNVQIVLSRKPHSCRHFPDGRANHGLETEPHTILRRCLSK